LGVPSGLDGMRGAASFDEHCRANAARARGAADEEALHAANAATANATTNNSDIAPCRVKTSLLPPNDLPISKPSLFPINQR